MKKNKPKKSDAVSIKLIENFRNNHLLNIKQGESFTIEEARIYSKNKIIELSKI
jgi:hypothetical protein